MHQGKNTLSKKKGSIPFPPNPTPKPGEEWSIELKCDFQAFEAGLEGYEASGPLHLGVDSQGDKKKTNPVSQRYVGEIPSEGGLLNGVACPPGGSERCTMLVTKRLVREYKCTVACVSISPAVGIWHEKRETLPSRAIDELLLGDRFQLFFPVVHSPARKRRRCYGTFSYVGVAVLDWRQISTMV